MNQGLPSESSEGVLLQVSFTDQNGPRQMSFRKGFRIGRSEPCELCLHDEHVSRAHAEVRLENGQWWLLDLHSSNGLYVNNQRVERVPIQNNLAVRFGIRGLTLSFIVTRPAPAARQAGPPRSTDSRARAEVVSHYVDHFLGKPTGRPAGEQTMLVHQAIQQIQRRQAGKYRLIVTATVVLACVCALYALHLHLEKKRQREIAQDLFYSIKTLDVNIANVERLVSESNSEPAKAETLRYREQRKALEDNYDKYLISLKLYNEKMTEPQRLILRIARVFGECELAAPEDFTSEVERYIRLWQSSRRYARAIKTAEQSAYNVTIPEAMLAEDLPPQFFYLAMQESDFDPLISGPETRKGIAKGMWQFIPSTAVKYGLKIGPLADLRRPDPGDDRHHYDRETKAAARYLKDLYSTDAQASGLLVMACYNWGEDSVLPLVRQMPPNPKDRNFWKLLATSRDKIPQETYNYVFYIISAAVIGENPRLFGFEFDNPLAHLGK